MSFSTSVLHSQGKETKTQLFTRPLRGVLGGKEFTLKSDDKGKKIMKVWQRAMLGTVLFTVGLPYTAVAGAILMCSKPKNTQGSSKKVSDVVSDPVPAPIENELTAVDIKALSYLFEGANVKWNDIEILPNHYKFSGFDQLKQQVIQFNQPTFIKVRSKVSFIDILVIPLEKKDDEGNWVRSVCLIEHDFNADLGANWIAGMDFGDPDVTLPLGAQPDAASIQPYKDLLHGKVVSKDGAEFRLFVN